MVEPSSILTLSCPNRPGIVAAVSGRPLVAERFGMAWVLRHRAERRRVLLLVSKFDHCLADLLYRWRIGELPMDLVGIAANHPRETFGHLDVDAVPFHHLPVTRDTKLEQEGQLWALIRDTQAEPVVLA